MRAHPYAVALALAACWLAGCAPREDKEPPPKPPAGPSVAERVRVLAADVFVIDGRHIRLADVVTPQPIPDARCWAEALAAKQATLAARALVHDARALRIAPTGRKDEYGREIAHVFLDSEDLAHTLHDAGFAAEAQPGRFNWCDRLSAGGEGAPEVTSLMDFSRG